MEGGGGLIWKGWGGGVGVSGAGGDKVDSLFYKYSEMLVHLCPSSWQTNCWAVFVV